MSWHTEAGDRYLIGAEARLVRNGLRCVIEAIEDNAYSFEHTMLHRQSRKSLLHLFAFVGTHLLRPTDALAPLNAWTEGAVGIVFSAIKGELAYELDTCEDEEPEHSHRWRQMIDAAYQEALASDQEPSLDEEDPVVSDCEPDEAAEYRYRLEFLQDQILWDTDWVISTEVDRALADSQVDYFAWSSTSSMTTKEAIKVLGDLCGFRRGEFEGIEVE